jgi:DNA-binding transcriptional ArsR family regulator
MVMHQTQRDSLSLTFGALSDPTRRRILAILAGGERSVIQLVERFDVTQPAISKHLKVLERAGLIVRGREAQWRPARMQGAPLKEAKDWMEQYRQTWEVSFDRLGDYLEVMDDKPSKKKPRRVRKSKKSISR